MSLFPFFGDTVTEQTASIEELPLYKEVAWDFKNNVPIIDGGDYRIVTGNEAIKTWVYKALKTERFRYKIYSWDFGSEIDSLIGQNYTPNLTKAECIRYIEESILINPYVKGVANMEVDFHDGLLEIRGELETVYGRTEVNLNV